MLYFVQVSGESREFHLAICWVLCQADEPAPVGNYSQRKEEEEKLLLKLSQQLQKLLLVLDQDNVTKSYAG